MRLEIVIPLPPISKKNHSRIVSVHGRPMILPSKQYVQYEKDCALFMPRLDEPISTPVNVSAKFYMPTRRHCDLTNLLQAIDDILVKYEVLKDDNRNVVYALDGSRVLYDKINPRTELVITAIPDGEFERWADG